MSTCTDLRTLEARREARTKDVVAEWYKPYPFLKGEMKRDENEIYALVKKLAIIGTSITLTGFNYESRVSLCGKVLEPDGVSLKINVFVQNKGVLMPSSTLCCTITSVKLLSPKN